MQYHIALRFKTFGVGGLSCVSRGDQVQMRDPVTPNPCIVQSIDYQTPALDQADAAARRGGQALAGTHSAGCARTPLGIRLRVEGALRGYFGVGVDGMSKPMNLGNLVRIAHAFDASFFFSIAPRLKLSDAAQRHQQCRRRAAFLFLRPSR